jgi:hypothetical protein
VTEPAPLPRFAVELLRHLRRHGLPLGVDDCQALRLALSAGFGLRSDADLRTVCVALWAKSPAEADVIRAAFARVEVPVWAIDEPVGVAVGVAAGDAGGWPAGTGAADADLTGADPTGAAPIAPAPAPVTEHVAGLGLAPPSTGSFDPSLVVLPQYPVTEREVAQAWRRLRRPVRRGPNVELDMRATLHRYARTGVATAPVLVPRRRNTARLVLLIDRQGSMTPFHGYVDHVCRAITNAGRLDAISVAYFHNVPGRSRDQELLADLPDPFSPLLDPVLRRIAPLAGGRVYRDPALTEPRPLSGLLDELTANTAVAVLSDAGALRGSLHTGRLLDTAAMVKALYAAGAPVAWLNPLPAARWRHTTAGQIARHVPMSPLSRAGMYQAVDVLRGRPRLVERPL